LKQLCDDLGNPRLPPKGEDQHTAIADARWNKQAWESCQDYLAQQLDTIYEAIALKALLRV
jgi:hypothetical protein